MCYYYSEGPRDSAHAVIYTDLPGVVWPASSLSYNFNSYI